MPLMVFIFLSVLEDDDDDDDDELYSCVDVFSWR